VPFDPNAYGSEIAALLALDGAGDRLMPLAGGRCSTPEVLPRLARLSSAGLFSEARAPEAALAGLYLYFSCWEEAHRVAQDIPSPEGSYWHGIVHRQEPDPGNAAYWFRQVGRHAIFPALREEAARLSAGSAADLPVPASWDPFAFIDLCEKARRQPGSDLEALALHVQRAEWQILFDYCARPRSGQ
jgi:hypothetical protein